MKDEGACREFSWGANISFAEVESSFRADTFGKFLMFDFYRLFRQLLSPGIFSRGILISRASDFIPPLAVITTLRRDATIFATVWAGYRVR